MKLLCCSNEYPFALAPRCRLVACNSCARLLRSLARFGWFGPCRSVPSCQPEIAHRRCGVTATALTGLLWPSRLRIVWPLSRSQTRSVSSFDPTQPGTVGCCRHGFGQARVTLEAADSLASLQVPEPQRSVIRTGGRDRGAHQSQVSKFSKVFAKSA